MINLNIANRTIGPDQPVLVIAEIGVNHDGSAARAVELVRIAHRCGADAVKLQLFSADRLMHESSAFAEYQKSTAQDATPADMLRRYELSEGDVRFIVSEIDRLGMLALATPFSCEDVDLIESLDLPAIKIASPDLVNWPLLRRASQADRPMLVSCGAATIGEVSSSVAWLRGWHAPFSLLHCISHYPTSPDDAHLGWIEQMRTAFEVPVGFSDHTTQLLAGALAVAAGACIIEKHITHDRGATGPDHAASFDEMMFAEYVTQIRLAGQMRGSTGKRVLSVERDVRTVSRQSIVARRAILPGQIISEADLTVQRPGTGIPASAMPAMIGRRAGRHIAAGEMLNWTVIRDAA